MNNEWENVGFHQSLQQFATQVSYISCLQTGGKLAAEEAYQKIQSLYLQLQQVQH
jgi:hypothetical protein